ncbi:MAG: lysylphosphatidylglycerol synthase domain-containing protein [Acidobacteriota bacterium]
MIRLLFLLLGTLLLGLLVWSLGPSEILRVTGELGWHSLPILLCFSGYQLMRAVALKLSILRGRQVPFRDALWIRLSGDAMQSLTFSGPFLAEPTKAWLLRRRGLTLSEGFAATLTEYLANLFVGAAMCGAGLLYIRSYGVLPPSAAGAAMGLIVASAGLLIAAATAIVTRFYLIGTVIGWLGRLGVLRGRLKPDVAAINRMEDLLLGVLHDRPARLATVLFVEAVAQAALVLEVLWVLRALEFAAPAIYPLVIEAATKFIGLAFFFVPLQIGAAEGSYAVIFTALGLPAAAGFSLAFVRRCRSLLVASAGVAALNALTSAAAPQTTERM